MASSAVFTWLVQHAAWLCNRYQPHHGRTPFERLRGRTYHGAVFALGQPVMLRDAEVKSLAKLAPRRVPGAWLGKSVDADEHIVATAYG
eukprot:6248711-Heterocapsa_arctica.AAC.1